MLPLVGQLAQHNNGNNAEHSSQPRGVQMHTNSLPGANRDVISLLSSVLGNNLLDTQIMSFRPGRYWMSKLYGYSTWFNMAVGPVTGQNQPVGQPRGQSRTNASNDLQHLRIMHAAGQLITGQQPVSGISAQIGGNRATHQLYSNTVGQPMAVREEGQIGTNCP